MGYVGCDIFYNINTYTIRDKQLQTQYLFRQKVSDTEYLCSKHDLGIKIFIN